MVKYVRIRNLYMNVFGDISPVIHPDVYDIINGWCQSAATVEIVNGC